MNFPSKYFLFTKSPTGKLASTVILVLGIVFFGWYYFTIPEANSKYTEVIDKFYPELGQNFYIFTEEQLARVTTDSMLSDWELQIVRSALVRWHLRVESEKPFEYLMDDYAEGLWSVPERKHWEEALTKLDTSWQKRRGESLSKNVEIPFPRDRHTSFGKELTFHTLPYTVDLGCLLTVVIETDEETAKQIKPQLYWQLSTTGIDGNHCLLGSFQKEGNKTKGPNSDYTMEFDLSHEPQWLVPEAQLQKLIITIPLEVKIKQFGFTDSKYLPLITEETGE